MAERKIKGRVFKVVPMLAGEAIELYSDIIRIVGQGTGRLPAIVLGLSQKDTDGNLLSDVAAVMALTDILSGSSSAEISGLVKRIVEIATISRPSGNYEPVDLDGDFTGHLADIPEVVAFILKEQFGDFFTGSGGNGIIARMTALLRP
jgi:hypothetical protein